MAVFYGIWLEGSNDRRSQPTQGLTRYSLFGQRKSYRRKIDQQRGGYVDRYNSALFFFLILIMGLNLLDSLFTMMIIDMEGWEVNPIVRSVIGFYGDKFWIWKFGVVSLSLIILCIHIQFRKVKSAIFCISFIYFIVVIYQIFLINYQWFNERYITPW